MEFENIKLKIHRKDELVQLIDETGKFQIDLSGEDTSDLKNFFDNLFNEIIRSRKLICFELEDKKDGDLIDNVSNDLIEQLNAEIRESEKNFEEIIKLNNSVDSVKFNG